MHLPKKTVSLHPLFKKNELVAQQVEHIPFKDGVLGSSPSWLTHLIRKLYRGELVAQQVEHIPFKDGVLGSSPSWLTKNVKVPEIINFRNFFFFFPENL